MQTRILRAFLLVALLPLLFASLIAHVYTDRLLTEQVLNQLESLAEVQQHRLENIVERNLERLQGVASRTQMRISLERYQREPSSADRAKMEKIIGDALRSVPDFIAITLVDPQGQVVVSTRPTDVGAVYADRPYVRRGKQAAQADSIFLNEHNEPRLYLSGPLKLDEQLIGVVVIESRVDTLIDLAQDYTGLGRSGETLIAAGSGLNATFLTPLRFDADAALRRTVSMGKRNSPVVHGLNGESGLYQDAVDYRGERVLAAVRHLPNTGWGLAVKKDHAEAFAPLMQLRIILGSLIGLTSLLILLASMVMARSITRPVAELSEVVMRLQTGDVSRRCAIDAPGEIGELQRGFNAMVDYLEDFVGSANEVAEGKFETEIQLHGDSDKLGEALQGMRDNLQRSYGTLSSQKAELESTNEELARQAVLLEEQTEALQEKNLALGEARNELEVKAAQLARASQYKSDFLANMSHELRTPLNSLLILARMLGENKPGNLTDKQVKYAQTIYRSGTDLLDLINDILDLSKVEAGRLEFNIFKVRPEEVLAELERMFRLVAEEKKVSFEVKRGEGLPEFIHTDDKRLLQILKNLLSNAFKFTSKGGVTLTLERPGSEARLQVEGLRPEKAIAFRVADTGIGIPEDKQALIFDSFQQADGSTSRSYGGTGLGLSIAREFSQRLGGEVQVESVVNQGSTFSIILPEWTVLSEQEEVSDAPAEAASEPVPAPLEAEPAKPAKPPMILIVEDDIHFAQLLTRLVDQEGYRFMVAHEGRSGLQLARSRLPDAIILDVNLPNLNGIALKEALNEDERTRNIPVLFISAMEPSEQVHRLGIAGYLTKPADIADVKAAMDRIALGQPGGGSVLIVEDDPVQQESLSELFRAQNMTVDVAASVEGARTFLQTNTYDAMVLDLGLYGHESGFDLLEETGEYQSAVLPPVIVHTASELNSADQERLRPFSDCIILKSERSGERLVDEVKTFVQAVPAQAGAEAVKPQGDLAGRHILIVDDDARNTFALRSALEDTGLNISTAGGGKDALQILREMPGIQLVLMDVMMPDMDGYETTRAIREDDQIRDIPIIALTAKAMPGDREACMEAGANDYLAKPVNLTRLLGLIRVWAIDD